MINIVQYNLLHKSIVMHNVGSEERAQEYLPLFTTDSPILAGRIQYKIEDTEKTYTQERG